MLVFTTRDAKVWQGHKTAFYAEFKYILLRLRQKHS